MSLTEWFKNNFISKWRSGWIELIAPNERWRCFQEILEETILSEWWLNSPHGNIRPFPHLYKDMMDVKKGHDETISEYCKDINYKHSHDFLTREVNYKPHWRDMLENFARSIAARHKEEWKSEFYQLYPAPPDLKSNTIS